MPHNYGSPDRYIHDDTSSNGGGAGGDVSVTNFPTTFPEFSGTWAYHAGISGVVNVVGRVLQITAVALQAAGSITINGGDTIPLPYGATDKVSTSITICPEGTLDSPTITFTNTDSYFIEVLQ